MPLGDLSRAEMVDLVRRIQEVPETDEKIDQLVALF